MRRTLKITTSEQTPFEQHKSEYESVNKAIKYLFYERSGSDSSIRKLKNVISLLSRYASLNPDELVKLETNQLEKTIKEFLYTHSNKSTANSYLQTIKTFFRENDREDIKYPRFHIPSRSEIKALPISLKDVWKMVEYAPSLKYKCIILMLMSSGLRISTLLSIKIGEVESETLYLQRYTLKNEIDEGQMNPVIIVYPKMKKVIKDACKNKIPYFTFICKGAKAVLEDYFRWRRSRSEEIKDNDLLFPSDHRGFSLDVRRRKPMTINAVNKMLKDIAKKASVANPDKISAKSFRILFENILDDQYKNASLSENDREFLMGHILPKPVEHYYRPEYVEKLRIKYAKVKFNPKEVWAEFDALKHVAEFCGIDYEFVLTEAKRKHEKPDKKDVEDILKEIIRRKKEQKIIDVADLQTYLQNGFDLVSVLDNKKTLVKRDLLEAIAFQDGVKNLCNKFEQNKNKLPEIARRYTDFCSADKDKHKYKEKRINRRLDECCS